MAAAIVARCGGGKSGVRCGGGPFLANGLGGGTKSADADDDDDQLALFRIWWCFGGILYSIAGGGAGPTFGYCRGAGGAFIFGTGGGAFSATTKFPYIAPYPLACNA